MSSFTCTCGHEHKQHRTTLMTPSCSVDGCKSCMYRMSDEAKEELKDREVKEAPRGK